MVYLFKQFIKTKFVILSFFLLFILGTINTVYPITANDILKKIDNLGNYKTSMAKLAMVIYPRIDNSKEYRIIKMIGYSKGKDNSYYKYVYPNSVKGMKMLSRADDIWMFFPSTGRKRKIASYNKKQTVEGVGGDFSYQDMTMGDYAKDYSSKILNDKNDTWTLELIPLQKDHAYKKLKVTVIKSNYRVTQIKYYDEDGFLKSLFLTSYKKIKSYDIPMTMLMINYRSKSKTIIKIVDLRIDVNISNKYFDADKLESN